MAGSNSGDGKTPTLNVVSMVDVIFNVIVFFILTAKAADEEMVKVFVPRVEAPAVTPIVDGERRLVVTLLYDHEAEIHAELNRRPQAALLPELLDGVTLGPPRFVQVGKVRIDLAREDAYRQVTDLIIRISRERRTISTGADGKSVNPLEVLVRANIAAPYRDVQPLWMAIMGAQISKANLMTLTGR